MNTASEIKSVTNSEGVLSAVPGGTVASPLPLAVASVDSGKTAKIEVTVHSTNYADFDAVITVNTIDKIPVTIAATMNGGVYKGSAYAYTGVTVKRNDTDADVTSTVTLDALYESTDGAGYSNAAAPSNAGTYRLTLSVPDSNATYAGSAVFTFSITEKTVTVKADDKAVKQGGALPAPTVSYTGFVGTDATSKPLTAEAAATHTAADTQTTGTFLIEITTYAVLNGGAGKNYTLAHQNGTLTVNPLSTACDVTAVSSPSGVAISGTNITASVANGVSSQLISLTTSADATWKLYSDSACTTEITSKTMTLNVGANTAYIKVTAEDGTTTKTYAITITRASSGGGGGNNGSGGSDSGGSSGGGGGSNTSSTSTTPSNAPTDVSQNQAQSAATSAAAAAKASGSSTATVNMKNLGNIPLAALQAMAKAAGMPVKFQADSMTPDGKAVDVRIALDPAKSTKGLNLTASTSNSSAKSTKSFFEKWFKNNVSTINFGQQGGFGQPVEIAAKVDLAGMDTTKLEFYAYDKATNTYRRIEKPAYWIDKNGYLHFTTELAGDIVISDGPLEKKS